MSLPPARETDVPAATTSVATPEGVDPWRVGVSLWVRPSATNDVDDIVEQAHNAHRLGIDAVWLGQRFDLDSLSMAAIVGAQVPGLRVGTSIVPINPRHPIVVASQAQTAQAAAHGRFTLGIGLGAPELEIGAFGIDQKRPIRRLREYLQALRSLIEYGAADVHGETLTAHPPMPANVRGGNAIPILVAAMGPQAVAVAGELADGTLPFLAGPRTLDTQIVAGINRAATQAGRPRPHVVPAVVAVVTDDPEPVRERAIQELAFYEGIPSYRRVLDHEGVRRAGDLAVIGDEAHVVSALRRYRDAGATELLVTQTYLGGPDAQQRTWELLGSLRT